MEIRQGHQKIFGFPKAYLRNWVANTGRLLFSYPYARTPQKISTYYWMAPNMFIVVLLIFSTLPACVDWRRIPFEFYAMSGFALIALGGQTLIFAVPRYFLPLVPVFTVWIIFVLKRYGVRVSGQEIIRQEDKA